MGIETSMYIKIDLLKKLDETAAKMDISRSKLISLLIMKYMDKNQPTDKLFKSLKYQDSDDEAVFITKSIYLREDAYEVWGDLRKVYKFSGSLRRILCTNSGILWQIVYFYKDMGAADGKRPQPPIGNMGRKLKMLID